MDLLIFDLDGTLIDSRLDLAAAVNAMRLDLGMSPLANERIYTYVGNGAPVLVRRALGEQAAEADLAKGLSFFMEYYGAHDLDFTTLYPGVRESARPLPRGPEADGGAHQQAHRDDARYLKGLGVDRHFFQVYGGDSFEQKKPHPIGVETLMREARRGWRAHHDGGR